MSRTLLTGYTSAFALLACFTIGNGIFTLLSTPNLNWFAMLSLLLATLAASLCQMNVSKAPDVILVGFSITILTFTDLFGDPSSVLGVWVIAVFIARWLHFRQITHALYETGTAATGAIVWMLLAQAGQYFSIPLALSLVISSAGFHAVLLLCWKTAQRIRKHYDSEYANILFDRSRLFTYWVLTPVISVILAWLITVAASAVSAAPAETDTLVAVLFAATGFALISSWSRNINVERRIDSMVHAAVDLPRDSVESLSNALQARAQKMLRTHSIELRTEAPHLAEIGASVSLEAGVEQYLVASRRNGGAPFARDDKRALETLAFMASEAARVHYEVNNLERRANTDPLTGLPNYGAFQLALAEANENRAYHTGVALLFIDLDNFKQLNDSYGHHVGDQMLQTVAARILAAVTHEDVVSRVGGDEFVVIIRNVDTAEIAQQRADLIIESISSTVELDGHFFRPVVSAGLAFSGHRELDAHTLVVDADRTMLGLKRSRQEGALATDSALRVSTHQSSRTNAIIARAITEDRLSLAFQPIIDVATGKPWAHEALLRYVDPEIGPISAPSLVARAKNLGLLNRLTEQVIRRALEAAELFYRADPEVSCIAINLELGQISEEELGPFLCEAAATYPNLSLCIELNERSLRGVTEPLRQAALALQKAGIVIALDDYGSDDSLVSAIVNFPMNIFKLDRSLIENMNDPRQKEIVRALQSFGTRLGYTVIVEGVEDQATATTLHELGVHSAQGYFHGKPAPAKDILLALSKEKCA